MSVDFDALCDRLYADTLGATLRRSGTFWRADTTVCWADIETHVRQRADAHGQDLSATPEEVARALNETENIWRTITAGDRFAPGNRSAEARRKKAFAGEWARDDSPGRSRRAWAGNSSLAVRFTRFAGRNPYSRGYGKRISAFEGGPYS